MASKFGDTLELERSLLNLVLSSKLLLRQNLNKISDDFFRTKERKLIRELIVRTYQSSKGLLTKELFEYDLKSRIPDGEHHFYQGEWNMIAGLAVSSQIETIIDRLAKAHKGRQLLDAIERSVDMIESKGQIDEAEHNLKTAIAKLKSSRGSPEVIELTDYRSRLETIMDKKAHPENYLGIKTGFTRFDDQTGGLFPGELTLFSGITGLGKSTLLKQVETGIITKNHKKNVLHICNEEHLLQVLTKFDAQITQIPYKDFKLASISDEDIEKWKEAMDVNLKLPNLGHIYVKEVPAFTDVTLIEETLNELELKGVKIHVVIIDHLPHVKPIEQAWGEYDEQGKAAADCKELARAWKISVVTATQAATVVEEKQSKGRKAGKLDVYGSKEQVHVANTSISITLSGKVTDQEDRPEWERDVFWSIDIKKNRDGATFFFKARHHVRCGYVEEIAETPSAQEAKNVDDAIKEAGKHSAKKDKKGTTKEVAQTPPATVSADAAPPAQEKALPKVEEPSNDVPSVESEASSNRPDRQEIDEVDKIIEETKNLSGVLKPEAPASEDDASEKHGESAYESQKPAAFSGSESQAQNPIGSFMDRMRKKKAEKTSSAS